MILIELEMPIMSGFELGERISDHLTSSNIQAFL